MYVTDLDVLMHVGQKLHELVVSQDNQRIAQCALKSHKPCCTTGRTPFVHACGARKGDLAGIVPSAFNKVKSCVFDSKFETT